MQNSSGSSDLEICKWSESDGEWENCEWSEDNLQSETRQRCFFAAGSVNGRQTQTVSYRAIFEMNM